LPPSYHKLLWKINQNPIQDSFLHGGRRLLLTEKQVTEDCFSAVGGKKGQNFTKLPVSP
jgi:hypothetical protein